MANVCRPFFVALLIFLCLSCRKEAVDFSADVKPILNKHCISCHGGVNLGGQGYFPFGVVAKPGAEVLPPGDKGRFAVTKTASDEYVFKSPSLRNITLTAPYFHSGKVWDLRQAVAIMGSSQLGATLTDKETDAIVDFLRTLTGRQPNVTHPVLPPHTASTPLPDAAVKPPTRH